MSTGRKEPRLVHRLFAKAMDFVTEKTQGYTMPFTSEFFNTLGVVGFLRFTATSLKVAETVTERYGDRDTQCLMGLSATWNGCEFCGIGHLYAANLYHYQKEKNLFPLDEISMPEIMQQTDTDGLTHILTLLAAPQYTRLRELIKRLHRLKSGTASGKSEEDLLLKGIIAVWDYTNECSIISSFTRDSIPPTAPIAKDLTLRKRYIEARTALRNAEFHQEEET